MFERLQQLPPDPILGLSAAFKTDTNPSKIDLGVGVYKDESGHTPILSAVAEAADTLLQEERSKVYISPQGVQGFIDGMLNLLFADSISYDRIAAIQAPGGCGSLRVLAETITRIDKHSTIWVSDPTWANHIPLLGNAGLELKTYPYFDKQSASVVFDQMIDTLKNHANPGDFVLLHGCCHNPTGADFSQEQWDALVAVLNERDLVPFIDMAYQGFGDGLEQDAYGLRTLAKHCPEVVLAASCSKNFGLYRERVGLAAVVCSTTQVKDTVQSQIQNVARGIYSMPPSYGGALVDIVLNDDALRASWKQELEDMRLRMTTLKSSLIDGLKANNVQQDFSFLMQQKGMFSFLCISKEQVQRLRNEYSIYFVDSSRINVAGINKNNVDYLANSLAEVLR